MDKIGVRTPAVAPQAAVVESRKEAPPKAIELKANAPMDGFDAGAVGKRLEVRPSLSTPQSLGAQLSAMKGEVTFKLANGAMTLPRDSAAFTQKFRELVGPDAKAFKAQTGLDANDFKQLLGNLAGSGVTASIDLRKGELAGALKLSDGRDGNYGFSGAQGQWQRFDGIEIRNPRTSMSVLAAAASGNQIGNDGVDKVSPFTSTLIDRLRNGGGDVLASVMQAAAKFSADGIQGMQVSTLQVAGSRTAPTGGEKKTLALLIGNSDYAVDPGKRLSGVELDVPALANALEGKADVTVLKNQSARKMEQAIAAQIESAKPGDDVLIYFSGHGVPSGVLGSDATGNLSSGVLSSQTLNALAKKAQEKGVNFGVTIDACHGGSLGEKARLADVASLRAQAAAKGAGPEVLTRLDAMSRFVKAKDSAMTAGIDDAPSPKSKAWKLVAGATLPATPLSARELDSALEGFGALLSKAPSALTAADLGALRNIDHSIDVQLNAIRRSLG